MDINVQWLIEQGWNSDLDRLRYSPEQLYIRRFDPTPSADFCVVCQMTGVNDTLAGSVAGNSTNGDSPLITMYGNDQRASVFQTNSLHYSQLFIIGD